MITRQYAPQTCKIRRCESGGCRRIVSFDCVSNQLGGYRCRSDGSDRSTHAGDHITGSIDNLVVGVVESDRNGHKFASSRIRIAVGSRGHGIECHMITGQHAGETAEVCGTYHRRSRGVVDLGRGPDKTYGYRCRSDGSDRP